MYLSVTYSKVTQNGWHQHPYFFLLRSISSSILRYSRKRQTWNHMQIKVTTYVCIYLMRHLCPNKGFPNSERGMCFWGGFGGDIAAEKEWWWQQGHSDSSFLRYYSLTSLCVLGMSNPLVRDIGSVGCCCSEYDLRIPSSFACCSFVCCLYSLLFLWFLLFLFSFLSSSFSHSI